MQAPPNSKFYFCKLALLTGIHGTEHEIIREQRVLIWVISVCLVLIGIALGLLARQYRRVKLQNRLIASANQVKNRLFSIISHDLRSPLAQVVGLLDLSENNAISPEEALGQLPVIRRASSASLELLDNLLTWSKNQLQGFRTRPVLFRLAALAEKVARKKSRELHAKQLTLVNEIDPALEVFADLEMIRIVLRNLLANAVKFTPDFGTITLLAEAKERTTVFSLKDTGVGMTEESLQRLFTIDLVSTRGTGNEAGTGLGLQICWDMVILNGGRIWAESLPGEGSTFFVELPAVTWKTPADISTTRQFLAADI